MNSGMTKTFIQRRIESYLKRHLPIRNEKNAKEISNTAEDFVDTLFAGYYIVPKNKIILVNKINESTYKNAYCSKTYDIKDITVILNTAEPIFSGPKSEYKPPYFWICLK